MVPQLTLVVVAAKEPDFADFRWHDDTGTVEVLKIINVSRESLASIGNRYMEATEAPVFGLCHADCGFGPGALAEFTRVALEGHVCGIVGIDRHRNYRWAERPEQAGPVDTLDSCAVFLRKDLGIRFDDVIFDSLHCHVEDLCLQAHRRGIDVVVPAAKATHQGKTTGDLAWQEEYALYRARLAQKWQGVRFETT